MKKNQIWRNNSPSINIAALKNRLAGKRVLLLDELSPDFSHDLTQYFDIVIAANPDLFHRTRIDIFIDLRQTPYTNYVLDCKCHQGHPETLFCMRREALLFLQKSKRRVDSHILVFDLIAGNPSSKILGKSGMKMGLAEKDPLLHLVLVGGAQEIYSTYETENSEYLSPEGLVEFVERKARYGIPINFKHKNRKTFIQNWV